MVNKYVASSGHALKVRGAHGYIDEVDEARRVVNEVDHILKTEYNGAGYVFHDNTSTSQSQNLRTITNFHNSKERRLDLSVHFNAASASASGVEVLHFGGHAGIAARLSKTMANALGLTNRGQKVRKDLYVLKNTNRPALLLEVCFVSSKKDADAYHKNFDKLCHAIADFVAEYLGYAKKSPTSKVDVAKSTSTETFYKTSAALGLYRVTKKCNTYSGVDFTTAKKLQMLKVGTAFTVVDIVKYGDKYRFKTKSGEYVSAKRAHLEKV